MLENRARAFSAIADAALLAVALAVGAAALLLAVAHFGDRFGVDHVAGTWLSLAAAVREGVFYPPLVDDGFYAGTRYVPLPFLLDAGVDLVVGDLLKAGKLVSLTAGAAVVALVVRAARGRGAPWPVALVLAAAVPVSVAGVTTILWIRGDPVAVALGLVALAVVEVRPTVRRALAGGLLAALAFLSMLTALWAIAALVAWLTVRDRRAALACVGAFAATTGVVLVAVEALSRGRMSDNAGLLFAGAGTDRHAFEGVRTLWHVAFRDQGSVWPLFVVAAVAVVLGLVRRRLGLYELALVASGAILLVVLRDVGAAANHLLPATALAAIVVAGFWSPEHAPGRLATALRVGAVVAVVAGIAVASRHTLGPEVRDVLRGDDKRYDRQPLAGLVTADDCLLAQDPTLPLLFDQRPVVLDPFMLLRLAERRQEDVDRLIARIERREFDRIVLFARPELDPIHFQVINLGSDVAGAIERSYRLQAEVESEPPVFVYAPRSGPRAPCEPVRLAGW